MEYRRLGRSDLSVSAIGLGCWAIGGPYWRTHGTTRGPMGWGWNLARSPRTIPIPGFKTVAQVEDSAGVLQLGPLSDEEMRLVARVVG